MKYIAMGFLGEALLLIQLPFFSTNSLLLFYQGVHNLAIDHDPENEAEYIELIRAFLQAATEFQRSSAFLAGTRIT